MGRGRTKGSKLPSTIQEETGSGEEEKIPQQKRRGRPQKSTKDMNDEDEVQKIEVDDSEDSSAKTGTTQDGSKRRRNSQAESAADSVKEDSPSTGESVRSTGFRQNGNRRKNKPRRAAEAVVECN